MQVFIATVLLLAVAAMGSAAATDQEVGPSREACMGIVQETMEGWNGHETEVTFEDLQHAFARWTPSCAGVDFGATETSDEVGAQEAQQECDDIVPCAVSAADEFCDGSGSTALGFEWTIDSPFIGQPFGVPDPGTAGKWEVVPNMLGDRVIVGNADGLIGGVEKTANVFGRSGTIHFGPLVLPATGDISPECQEIPIIADLGLSADYVFISNLDDLIPGPAPIEIYGSGTLCRIPC